MIRTLFLLGGSGDIGKAIQQKFIEKGYKVIAPTRQEINLEDRESIENYFKDKNFAIDVLMNCAGVNEPKTFTTITYEDIDKTLQINLLGFFRIIQHLLPGMIEQGNGHILAISSIYGVISRGKRLPYSMSKHALNALVKTLAIEFGELNIKVNSLSPGFVETKLTRKNNDEKTIKQLIEKIPLKRLATPEDVANASYMLCSVENTFISGQNIIVDGGYTIGGFEK